MTKIAELEDQLRQAEARVKELGNALSRADEEHIKARQAFNAAIGLSSNIRKALIAAYKEAGDGQANAGG